MMTRLDFAIIAEILQDSFGDDISYYAPSEAVGKLADYFATQDPCFDRERFLKACGL
jgi:hypothetical protein